MDPSHIYRAGENPVEAIAAVISRVKHVHIRDCKGRQQGPGKPEEQANGRGDIDLVGYIRVLHENGYTGPLDLEIIGAKEYSRRAVLHHRRRIARPHAGLPAGLRGPLAHDVFGAHAFGAVFQVPGVCSADAPDLAQYRTWTFANILATACSVASRPVPAPKPLQTPQGSRPARTSATIRS